MRAALPWVVSAMLMASCAKGVTGISEDFVWEGAGGAGGAAAAAGSGGSKNASASASNSASSSDASASSSDASSSEASSSSDASSAVAASSSSGGGGKCAHSPCVGGAPLNPACDPCVLFICQLVDPTCCTVQWDQDFCALFGSVYCQNC